MTEVRRAGPVTTFIFGIIFTVAGSAIAYFFTWPAYQIAGQSESWPTITGRIVSAKLHTKRSDKNDTYAAKINYSYRVGKTVYSGKDIYYGSDNVHVGDRKEVDNYLAKYQVGTAVKVYYHPQNNNIAVLEPGLNNKHKIFIGLTITFILVGLLLVLKTVFKFTILMVAVTAFFKHRRKKKGIPEEDIDPELFAKELKFYDEELENVNVVASSSKPTVEEPWLYEWVIIGPKKEWGPYPFKKVQQFYLAKKITDNLQCYSPKDDVKTTVGELMKKGEVNAMP